MKKIISTCSMLLLTNFVFAQSMDSLSKTADSFYFAKKYVDAAALYQKLCNLVWLPAHKKSYFYNAACCFALANASDQSLDLLNQSIKNGYANKEHLSIDSDLELLHKDKRWKPLLASMKTIKNASNPSQAQLIQSDIQLFYKAFDFALKDTLNAATIFKEKYFLKGTIGLQDFFAIKIRDEKKFARYVLQNKDFYRSIESTLLNINSLNKEIFAHLNGFKKRYPEAQFPNVYFVIGMQTSNGTVSDNGLLIGAEVMSKTTSNSINWQKEDLDWVMYFSQIPVTVSHEIVHFNQTGMKNENTLLKYAVIEGSAEFLAELITGKTDGNYTKFKGREKAIWSDFKKEMNMDIYNEWQSENEPKRPRNAMYWTGYMICKSYYENATDKSKAINDILNIKDYQDFFQKSKADDYTQRNF